MYSRQMELLHFKNPKLGLGMDYESTYVLVLRFFPKTKLQNAKFSTVIVQNFKSSNVKMIELPNFGNVTLQKSESSNVKMFEFPHFRMSKCLNCHIFELHTTFPTYWAALFSDNFALRGVFRLGLWPNLSTYSP
jgi:hypothetical protein